MKDLVKQQLRVFLSSTFSDMQEERDALVKLFRQLSDEGRRRGVDIKLVDLRWGVTADQKRTGRVIFTCLQEIDNSRPFFIGLVGDRYGWIPSKAELKINPELTEKFPAIREYIKKGLSITEIEMRYGALDSKSKDNSFFLIKDNSKIENDLHRHLSEEILSKNIKHEFYNSIEDLTSKTRDVMIDLLDHNFPILDNIPEWQQYENIHKNIAKSYSIGFIHYGDYIEQLNHWLKSNSQYLVISGESGSGKSSLISEWLMNNNFVDYKVACHFIGNGLAEGSHLDIQRHFLCRLENEYGLESTPIKTPDYEDDYISELENALSEAESRGDKWLFVVDGLDHLPDNAIIKLMNWFPKLPLTSKALFTTVSSDMTYKRLCEALGYEEILLRPLNKGFVVKIVNVYLANVGKSLETEMTELISSNPIFSNPNLLRLLLDELVTYGIYEKIREIVLYYASSKDKTEFYTKIIIHSEVFYGQKRVKDILMLILSTKDGLSENTITEILQLEPIEWAMTFAGLQRMLVFVNGKFRIANRDFKDAMNQYYEIEKADYQNLIDYALRIIKYYEKDQNEIEEMAYLYFCTGNLEKLHSLLINPNFIIRLVLADKLFALYWNEILEETDYTLYEYLDVDFIDLPNWDVDEQLFFLSNIISSQFSDVELSCKLMEKSNNILLSKCNDDKDTLYNVASNNLVIAQNHMDMGNIQDAEEFLQKAEDIYMQLGEKDDSYLIFTKANFENLVGRYNEAITLYLKAIELEKAETEDIPWNYYNNTGLAYLKIGQLNDAAIMFEQALTEVKKGLIEKTIEGATIFNNLGLTHYYMKELDKAEDYFNMALNIHKLNVENPGISVALIFNNLGLIFKERGKYNDALDYFMEASEIINTLSERSANHGIIYRNIGEIWIQKNDFDTALEWIKKSVDSFWDIVSIEHLDFQTSCDILIELFEETGKIQNACEFTQILINHSKVELGDINDIAAYLHLRKGDIYMNMNQREKALNEYNIAFQFFLELEDDEGISLTKEALSQF